MNGGRVLVEALLALGVDTGFTVPGESFLTVLESLRLKRDSFRLLSTRHESGAAFAAETFGRLSGWPAAVFVSRGPGATNAAIGIHTARQSSTPLLLFIGDVRTRSKGREAFQEIDHHRMFGPVAKSVMEPRHVAEIAAVCARAVTESMSGRPGPVVVVLPRDITESNIEDPSPSPWPVGRAEKLTLEAPVGPIRAAVEAISRARFPIIIAGEMICHEGAGRTLVQFADRLAAPVVSAYRQMDVFPNNHSAYAGHLEINRADFQRDAFAQADLVLAAGTRLDGITTEDYSLLRTDQLLVHIYPDAEVLQGAAAQVAVCSNVRPALTRICLDLADAPEERVSWRDGLHADYLGLSDAGATTSHGSLNLAKLVHFIAETVGDEAVLLTDGGSFARWVHRYYRFNTARRFAGPVSGAMGYAVPGALGAALACPSTPIIAFVGDGGFMMTGQELSTAAREGLNITIIVCDNHAHGSILYAQWHQYGASSDYATRIASPDFVAIAHAYGVTGWRVENNAHFPAVFHKAMAMEGPSLIHLITDQRDIVPGNPKSDVV